MEAFQQHDVEELYGILCEKIDEYMKHTPLEGTIKNLFEGKTKSYCQCVNVAYKSERVEVYWDIQLVVKGFSNVTESLTSFVKEELLDGDDKYDAGPEHGKQAAKKGVKFISFPPVLHLHLKRFEFDPYKETMTKINDRFEYPLILDLNQFLDGSDPDVDTTVDNKYALQSVLVHSGGASGGHYYAFIRSTSAVPTESDAWVKLDDHHVSKVTKQHAVDNNYGGLDDYPLERIKETFFSPATNASHKRNERLRIYNAYMLVYVRISDLPDVMMPVLGIPPVLQDRIDREAREKAERLREREDAKNYRTIFIVTYDNIINFQQYEEKRRGYDYRSFYVDFCDFSTLTKFRCHVDSTIQDGLIPLIEKELAIPSARQRLWTTGVSTNGCQRIMDPILISRGTREQFSLLDKIGFCFDRDFKAPRTESDVNILFLEDLLHTTDLMHPSSSDSLLHGYATTGTYAVDDHEITVCIRFWNPNNLIIPPHLTAGPFRIDSTKPLSDLESYLHREITTANATYKFDTKLYDFGNPRKVLPLKSYKDGGENSLITGDILYCAIVPPGDEASLEDHIRHSINQKLFHLVPHGEADTGSVSAEVYCSVEAPYEEFSIAVAGVLAKFHGIPEADPRLLRCYYRSGVDLVPIASDSTVDLFLSKASFDYRYTVYYEFLDFPLTDFECNNVVDLQLVDKTGGAVLKVWEVLIPADSDTMQPLFDFINGKNSELSSKLLRCMRIKNSRIMQIVKPATTRQSAMRPENDKTKFVVQVEQEYNVEPDGVDTAFLQVVHSTRQNVNWGIPILITVRKRQTVQEVRTLICSALELKTDDFSRFSLLYIVHQCREYLYDATKVRSSPVPVLPVESDGRGQDAAVKDSSTNEKTGSRTMGELFPDIFADPEDADDDWTDLTKDRAPSSPSGAGGGPTTKRKAPPILYLEHANPNPSSNLGGNNGGIKIYN
jgi:hypothetical protein